MRLATCPRCDGDGYTLETEMGCCGQYLGTGECCAAAYGTAYLEPYPTQVGCPVCWGAGYVEYEDQ